MTLTWSLLLFSRSDALAPALAGAAAVLRRIGHAAVAWRERLSERQAMSELDDHLLRDLGLTRVEIWRETSKPFWRS